VSVGGANEISLLARSFNRMADGLKEKEKLEQSLQKQTRQLQAQAEKLSTLNTLAATVGQSLNLVEILHSALDKVLELMKLRAGWVVLWNDRREELDLAASRGLSEGVALAQVQCAWNGSVCSEVLRLGRANVFPNTLGHSCPAAEYFRKEGLMLHACVPLKSKDHILGIMTLVSHVSDNVQEVAEDTLEMLTAIGRQIGIAVENASLYEELRQKEVLRRQLLERLITVQEEERKRVARELHDQTGQLLSSLIMTLEVFEDSSSPTEVSAHIEDLRNMAIQILEQVHDLALELRPSVLDDLGLLAALRHYFRGYQDRFHLPLEFQMLGLDGQRLPPEVETALYRIVQEALINVVRHAQAQSAGVLLENRGASVVLVVEDDGKGFDVTQVMGSRPHERNLGLYGMQERASLLGGTLTIESAPGRGTTIFVEIPLERGSNGYEKDPPVVG
jgi:signal transduction histidine kinase